MIRHRPLRSALAHAVSLLVPAALASAGATTLVPAGATWSYLDDGSNQGSLWRLPQYDATSWSQGPAQLGYGDGDEATVVSFGPDSNNKYITTYFRHAFDVPDPSLIDSLELAVLRDDAAIVYLNGTEVHRTNFDTAVVNYQTTAANTVSDTAEDLFFRTCVPASLLLEGGNLLAVEIHQRSGTSSDISFDLELIGVDGGPTVFRGPYLQSASPTGVVVQWRTCSETDGRVLVGLSPSRLDMEFVHAAVTNDHAVTLDGLSPGTTYYYAVGTTTDLLAGGDAEHRFATPPLAGPPASTRLWIVGDSGTADDNAAAVRDAFLEYAAEHPANLFLMLGDNAYNRGEDAEYQNAVFDMYDSVLRRLPLWPTLGNHDARSAASETESGVYYDAFTLPRAAEAGGLASGTEAYYSFDYANIHFICLDSHDSPRDPGGAMLTWLEADLADTLADWIIAFWHHPPYTKGSHNSDDPGDSDGRMFDMRQNVLPMLEIAGVDLVLCGHSHSYERSHLLDRHYGVSGTLIPEMLLDDGDGRLTGNGAYRKPTGGLASNEGAVYVVAGSSGKTSGGSLNHPAMFIGLNTLGSLVVDLDDRRLDGAFIDSNGLVQDTFTVLKGFDPADLDADGVVAFTDLLLLLGEWGPCPDGCGADIDDDGIVGPNDLLAVIASWS